ncbi:unnamed protein product [Polarella glacialis]|uniref:Uncharacterized protein n=1 Tax=Polarella glacialis TaxID=89957 RepID=A0A813F3U4_POLGL|nr:unnamed protein product [Polarella glacialis]CAE8674988.1 unnamed protein product [Polarella glacialis]
MAGLDRSNADWWEHRLSELKARCEGFQAELESQNSAISRAKEAVHGDRAATAALEAEAEDERRKAAASDERSQQVLAELESARQVATERAAKKVHLLKEIEASKSALGLMFTEANRMASRTADRATVLTTGLKTRTKELHKSLGHLEASQAKLAEQVGEERSRRHQLRDKTKEWLAEKDSHRIEMERQLEESPAVSAALEAEMKASQLRAEEATAESAKLRAHVQECHEHLVPLYCQDREDLLHRMRELIAEDDRLRDKLREAQEKLFRHELRVQERAPTRPCGLKVSTAVEAATLCTAA